MENRNRQKFCTIKQQERRTKTPSTFCSLFTRFVDLKTNTSTIKIIVNMPFVSSHCSHSITLTLISMRRRIKLYSSERDKFFLPTLLIIVSLIMINRIISIYFTILFIIEYMVTIQLGQKINRAKSSKLIHGSAE